MGKLIVEKQGGNERVAYDNAPAVRATNQHLLLRARFIEQARRDRAKRCAQKRV